MIIDGSRRMCPAMDMDMAWSVEEQKKYSTEFSKKN